MRKEFIRLFMITSLLAIFLSFNLYQEELNNRKIVYVTTHENIVEKILETNYEEELNKIRKEYSNNDIVGVLSIENTAFNEIVMQSTDNDYYLEHTVYHNYDWRGQTFLDYRVNINNSKKLIIYGHNSNYYNLPFEVFENYYNSDYLSEHKYLYLQTNEGINVYEIFSVYVEVDDWSYYSKMKFNNEEEYYKHILEFKNKSLYDTGVEINKDDEILIIQTCSTHKDYINYENKFLLVMGKKIDNDSVE